MVYQFNVLATRLGLTPAGYYETNQLSSLASNIPVTALHNQGHGPPMPI
jgi:hypothetical protein